MPKKPKYVDYLDEDPPVPGQKFVILSFVGPQRNQKCDVLGLKVRGVYDTIEETRERAKAIRDHDGNFDIAIGQVGYWLPFNPDSSKVMDEEYQENALNELVKGYRKNKQLAKQHFEERKRELMEEAIKEGSKEGQDMLANKEEHPLSVKNRINTLTEMLKEFDEKIEEAKNDLEESKKLWETFTPEQIEQAEKEMEELEKNVVNENNYERNKDEELKELQQLRTLTLDDKEDKKGEIEKIEETIDPRKAREQIKNI